MERITNDCQQLHIKKYRNVPNITCASRQQLSQGKSLLGQNKGME